MPRKPPPLPDGFVRAPKHRSPCAYIEHIYHAASLVEGKYIVRWNDGKWYMSTKESDGSTNWADPEAPIPYWYVGPFRSFREALATLILTITE